MLAQFLIPGHFFSPAILGMEINSHTCSCKTKDSPCSRVDLNDNSFLKSNSQYFSSP